MHKEEEHIFTQTYTRIKSEKVRAARIVGGCGSAPRNYGSCHGCSFVDGVFAPRGGCPNHEPRKLQQLTPPRNPSTPFYFFPFLLHLCFLPSTKPTRSHWRLIFEIAANLLTLIIFLNLVFDTIYQQVIGQVADTLLILYHDFLEFNRYKVVRVNEGLHFLKLITYYKYFVLFKSKRKKQKINLHELDAFLISEMEHSSK